MMRLAALVIGAAALTASAAAAAQGVGSRLERPSRPGPAISEADQAAGAKKLASCMFTTRNASAKAFLLAPSQEAADRAIKPLMDDVRCFSMVFSNDLVDERRVSYPNDILRGMLAEAALDRARPAVEALPSLPLQKVYQRSWFAVTGRDALVDEMGACIADTNPAGIAALIRTRPLTNEESAAFAALNDSLGKCLRIGTRLQASRQGLRAALADALYQRLYRPAEAPAAIIDRGTGRADGEDGR